MAYSLSSIVSTYLKYQGVTISKHLLNERLLTHPDYPALASVTDALDSFGISNGAYLLSEKDLKEIDLPFLAHVSDNGGEFRIANKNNVPENWSGTCVFAEVEEDWRNEENEKFVKKETNRSILMITAFVVAGISVILQQLLIGSLVSVGLLLTTIAGLLISVLILKKELGIASSVTDMLCGVDKSCESVINSKASKITELFSWADAGIIYFSTVLLLQITGNETWLGAIALVSLLFTVYSVSYQAFIIKKWCRLCLMVVGVLWVQAFIHLVIKDFNYHYFSLVSFGVTTFSFTAFAALWLLVIKPLMKEIKKLNRERFSLLKFKNSPDVFSSVLMKQRKVNTEAFENDIQIGNPYASIQLIVACNPYCNPCARMHDKIEQLMKFKDIGVIIRFSGKGEDPNDFRAVAIRHLLAVLRDKGQDEKKLIIHDWYRIMNLEVFEKKYPATSPDTDFSINESMHHYKWSDESDIKYTPTIFVNGYELPQNYNINVLKYLSDVSFVLKEHILSS